MAFTIEQVNTDIRYYLGGLPTSTLTDDILNDIITRTMTRNSLDFNVDSDYCKSVYYSLLESLRYLIRNNISSSAISGGGEIKSKMEKVGQIQIKTDYMEGSSAADSGWDDLYDDYLANPQYICEELADLAKSSFAGVYFGGVSQSEYDKVNNNQDSRNGWDVETPYRKSIYSCLRQRKK